MMLDLMFGESKRDRKRNHQANRVKREQEEKKNPTNGREQAKALRVCGIIIFLCCCIMRFTEMECVWLGRDYHYYTLWQQSLDGGRKGVFGRFPSKVSIGNCG